MFHIDFGDPLTPIILTLSPLPLALGAVRFGAAGFMLQSPPLIITLIGMMPPLSILIIGVAATGFCWSIGRNPLTISDGRNEGLPWTVTLSCPPLTSSVAHVFMTMQYGSIKLKAYQSRPRASPEPTQGQHREPLRATHSVKQWVGTGHSPRAAPDGSQSVLCPSPGPAQPHPIDGSGHPHGGTGRR